jgi:hypothetical protein
MTRAWTADMKLDQSGRPVGLITCRANDVPENTHFEDHRLFYARYDGTTWHVHQVAKLGARLWGSEQDYTGIGAVHPHDANIIYISTPIDPRDQSALRNHEIFKGVTNDLGATWQWTPITQNSSVDNLRPIIPAWDADHTAVLWFRGKMSTSQRYDCAIVGIIESAKEQAGPLVFVKADESAKETELKGLADGTYDVFALFKGTEAGDGSIRAGLLPEQMLLLRQPSSQQVEIEGLGTLYRGYVGRVTVIAGSNVRVATEGFVAGLGYAAVKTR